MKRIFAFVLACIVSPCVVVGAEPTVIADFETPIDGGDFEMATRDASARVVEVDGGHAVEVQLGNNHAWPHVRFNGRWDLSRHTHLLADLTNLSDESIRLSSKVTYHGGPQKENVGEKISLEPGETATMRIALSRPAPAGYAFLGELEGMDVMPLGYSGGSTIDPSRRA